MGSSTSTQTSRPQVNASTYRRELDRKLSRNEVASLLGRYFPNRGSIDIAEKLVGTDPEAAKTALATLLPKDPERIGLFFNMGKDIHDRLLETMRKVIDLKKSYLSYLSVAEEHFKAEIQKEAAKANPDTKLIANYQRNIELTRETYKRYDTP